MTLLMEPGPTQVDSRVIQAMCRPPIHHLAKEFVELVDQLSQKLARLLGTNGEAVILPSSGRGGMESVISSLDLQGRSMLIPTNGAFGKMMVSIAQRNGLDVVELDFGFGRNISPFEVSQAAKIHDVGLIGVVHCESSTGVLNDLMAFGKLARDANALLLVDAVSSFGGTPMSMDELGIDFCVTASQKAIGAVAGLAIVGVATRGISAILDRRTLPPSSYFDLAYWWERWLPAERGGYLASGYRRFPFSMPVHLVFALDAAVDLVLQEGTSERWDRHASAAGRFRTAMEGLGFEILGVGVDRSPTVTALTSPAPMDLSQLRAALLRVFDIGVAGPMGDSSVEMLRVGHMAETARRGPVEQTIAAIEAIVRRGTS